MKYVKPTVQSSWSQRDAQLWKIKLKMRVCRVISFILSRDERNPIQVCVCVCSVLHQNKWVYVIAVASTAAAVIGASAAANHVKTKKYAVVSCNYAFSGSIII